MQFNIPKDWIIERAKDEIGEIGAGCPITETGYARWSHELKTLAKDKGLEWLIGDDEAWMLYTYEDAATPIEALEELISEAQRSI